MHYSNLFQYFYQCAMLPTVVENSKKKFVYLFAIISYYNCFVNNYLIQNSQAVKKVCGPQKGYGEKRCEIQGGGQEMAVMVG